MKQLSRNWRADYGSGVGDNSGDSDCDSVGAMSFAVVWVGVVVVGNGVVWRAGDVDSGTSVCVAGGVDSDCDSVGAMSVAVVWVGVGVVGNSVVWRAGDVDSGTSVCVVGGVGSGFSAQR